MGLGAALRVADSRWRLSLHTNLVPESKAVGQQCPTYKIRICLQQLVTSKR